MQSNIASAAWSHNHRINNQFQGMKLRIEIKLLSNWTSHFAAISNFHTSHMTQSFSTYRAHPLLGRRRSGGWAVGDTSDCRLPLCQMNRTAVQLIFVMGLIVMCWEREASLRNVQVQCTLLHSSLPKQNSRHFANDIFRCISVNENLVFWFKFHRSLFPRVHLTIRQHWFR